VACWAAQKAAAEATQQLFGLGLVIQLEQRKSVKTVVAVWFLPLWQRCGPALRNPPAPMVQGGTRGLLQLEQNLWSLVCGRAYPALDGPAQGLNGCPVPRSLEHGTCIHTVGAGGSRSLISRNGQLVCFHTLAAELLQIGACGAREVAGKWGNALDEAS